jgi:hypothetical protein
MDRDLPPLDPDLQAAVTARVLAALRAVLGDALRGAILKGSAYKGGFIPGYSDIDIHVFCDAAVMDGPVAPRREVALALQVALGDIDPADYRANALQIFCLDADRYPDDWIPPPAGTYRVIAGVVPQAFHRPVEIAEHRRHALAGLRRSIGIIRALPGRIFDHPHGSLPGHIRRLGVEVKTLPYLAGALLHAAPERVWSMPWSEILALTEPVTWPRGDLRAFAAGLHPWPPGIPRCRTLLDHALAVADAVDQWLMIECRAGTSGTDS